MKNILIVEHENDKYFFEAMINHLNKTAAFHATIEIPVTICNIDEYECMGSLSQKKLQEALNTIILKSRKEEVGKIGIIIDQDKETKQYRINLINDAIKHSDFAAEIDMADTHKFIKLSIDSTISVDIACYFQNVDGQGELETVLKTIKSANSPHADCLDAWQECLKKKGINGGKGLDNKYFDKFWIQIYQRYDCCNEKEQTQAGRKCDNKASMSKPIWDFDHPALAELRRFLLMFS